MMDQDPLHAVTAPEPRGYSVPWSVLDTWLGIILLALVNVGLLLIALGGTGTRIVQSAALILIQLAFLLPLVLIFVWRHIPLRYLGFGRFDWNTLALGCGLLIASYVFIIVHNLILMALGVDTQGEAIFRFFDSLDSPIWFFFVGVVLAPIVEEIFFRGFVFQGFRQRYGWVSAMLISSAVFAAAHLDPVALFPTFIMGCVLAYMFQRSNSIWPGVILHFLVNAFGLCVAYVVTQVPGIIPT